jgi:hypothetical protein
VPVGGGGVVGAKEGRWEVILKVGESTSQPRLGLAALFLDGGVCM